MCQRNASYTVTKRLTLNHDTVFLLQSQTLVGAEGLLPRLLLALYGILKW